MKKVLIIGGAGYIGSHVNKYFNSQGKFTIILDNLSRGNIRLVKWGTFIEGDFADEDLLDEIFSKHQIELVIHLSALAYVGESVENPDLYYEANVAKTLVLLRQMRKHNVNKMIFSSTCATFGNAIYTPIDEKHPQIPINPYGRTKLIIEWILKDYAIAYGLNSVILRYFNAAGADPDGEIGELHVPETHLIPIIFEVVEGRRESLQVFGNDYPTKDGTCIRDYIHVTDLAEAHYLAGELLEKRNGIHCFNLGNSQGHSVLEVVDAVEKLVGKEVTRNMKPRRPGDPPILTGAYNHANTVLGWEPKHSELKTILSTAWKWFKSH